MRRAVIAGLGLLMVTVAVHALTVDQLMERIAERCRTEESAIRDLRVVHHIQDKDGTPLILTTYQKGNRVRIDLRPSADLPDSLQWISSMLNLTIIRMDTQIVVLSAFGRGDSLPSSERDPGELLPLECSKRMKRFGTAGHATLSEEEVAGRPAYVVRGKTGDTLRSHWIDRERMVVLREREQIGDEVEEIEYQDYRPIADGIYYPWRISTDDKDSVASVVVDSVFLNAGLADDVFDPDKVVIPKAEFGDMLETLFEGIKSAFDSLDFDSTFFDSLQAAPDSL